MRKIKLHKAILVMLILCAGLMVNKASAEPLRVGTYQFAPYFSADKEGVITGLWYDLLKKNLNSFGYQPVFENFAPPRLAKNVILGRTDITISAHHIAVDDHVYYSERPVTEIVLNAYHKKDRLPFTSIAALKGKTVILIRGYAYNGMIKQLRDPANAIKIEEVVFHTDAVKRLNGGNVDYLLDYRHPVKEAIKKALIDPRSFTFEEVSRYSTYYVVSNKLKGAKELIRKLDETLKK